MDRPDTLVRDLLAGGGYWFPVAPLTEAQRKARLVARIEDVLDDEGYEAVSRKLALVAVEAITNAEEGMDE